MHDLATITDVVDWGVIPTMIEGESRTSGVLLHKGPNDEAESGICIYTPGTWCCHVLSAEFCHFLQGRATYTHENGDVIEIVPDTVAFFPQGLERRASGARGRAQGLPDPMTKDVVA
tara:strand:- start:17294 stop:17644 length:351 start_codon:yes stop_codon:yes gene_type:complete